MCVRPRNRAVQRFLGGGCVWEAENAGLAACLLGGRKDETREEGAQHNTAVAGGWGREDVRMADAGEACLCATVPDSTAAHLAWSDRAYAGEGPPLFRSHQGEQACWAESQDV